MAKGKETISTKTDTGSAIKKSNKRSVKNIPTMPFEDAFIIAKGIWECASGQKVRRLTLFDHLVMILATSGQQS